MAVDWTKYPPQPEPPALPEWRDTPEREAYFEELEQKSILSMTGYILYCLGGFAILAGSVIGQYCDFFWGDWLCIAGGVTVITWLAYYLIMCLCRRIRLSMKYGFCPLSLQRPDVSRAVALIMANRPDFDEAEFRKYWPTKELANMALEIRTWVTKNWAIPGKMLFPNDSLMMLYSYKSIGDEEDYEDHFIERDPSLFFMIFDYERTFAELTEATLASRREADNENGAVAQT